MRISKLLTPIVSGITLLCAATTVVSVEAQISASITSTVHTQLAQQAPPQPQHHFAPDSLANLEFSYTIVSTEDRGLAPDPLNYPTSGVQRETYSDTVAVAYNFDAFFYDYSSVYSYSKLADNSAQYSIFGGHIVRTLNFTHPYKGTYVMDVGQGGGFVYGTFKAKPTNIVGFAPANLENIGFTLTIESRSDNPAFDNKLPPVGDFIDHKYGKHTRFFLQTDLYDEWDYQGDYFYHRSNNNHAKVNTYLRQSGLGMTIEYDFAGMSGGTWWGQFKGLIGNEVVLTGSFDGGVIEAPQKYDYEGKIEPKRSFTSNITGASYPYRVYLPESYNDDESKQQDKQKSYPVIYVSDGQWKFWDYSAMIEERELDVILVTIEQGGSNRRFVDYSLPGSADYLRFLKQEFMPLIEGQYRIDASERSIEGHSLGALLVAHAFYDSASNGTFKHFIASDGAYFHMANEYQLLEQAALNDLPAYSANLYLAGATAGGGDYYVNLYQQQLKTYNLPGLTIDYHNQQLRHIQVAYSAFDYAIAKIFSQ